MDERDCTVAVKTIQDGAGPGAIILPYPTFAAAGVGAEIPESLTVAVFQRRRRPSETDLDFGQDVAAELPERPAARFSQRGVSGRAGQRRRDDAEQARDCLDAVAFEAKDQPYQLGLRVERAPEALEARLQRMSDRARAAALQRQGAALRRGCAVVN